MRDWIQDLDRRPLHTAVAKGLQRKGRRQNRVGYSPSTIKQYLAGVSSFYTFAGERYTITDRHGRTRPLHPGPNPARAVRRPSGNPFAKADYLEPEAITAILAVIPTHTVQGLRDLALILGYVLTGRRNSEWRRLRWGDIEQRGTKAYHVWSGKGKQAERHELAPPVWNAICEYLKATGRLDTMQPKDYIFVPLNDRATHFRHVPDSAWDRDRPLGRCQANRLLKKYARRVGLDPTQVTVHTLRHSFAMLLDSLGVDVKTISKRLAHSNLNVTMIYLDHLKGVPDQTWRQAAAALNLDLLNAPDSSQLPDTPSGSKTVPITHSYQS